VPENSSPTSTPKSKTSKTSPTKNTVATAQQNVQMQTDFAMKSGFTMIPELRLLLARQTQTTLQIRQSHSILQ
jgi:hypothetical protein